MTIVWFFDFQFGYAVYARRPRQVQMPNADDDIADAEEKQTIKQLVQCYCDAQFDRRRKPMLYDVLVMV